jgi:type IV secretory pathway VirB9-like protein
MRNALVFGWLSLSVLTATATAQQTTIDPQVRTKPTADSKITAIELAAHFVTTIRVPEPVNSVVVGDPALFQVEHSEHEPELVFVKALTNEHAESNLLISTARGRQISFLLVSLGDGPNSAKVDFLLRYQPSGGFLVEPDAVPSSLVAQTASVSKVLQNRVVPCYPPHLLRPTLRWKERRPNPNRTLSTACWNARNRLPCPCFMASGWKAMT